MLGQGLAALILANGPLAALIGNRVTPVLLPDASPLPALVFQQVSQVNDPNLTTVGLQRVRMQFDAFGATYSDADSVRDALRQLLDRYQGTLPDGTYVQDAIRIQALDLPFDDAARNYRCMSEFYFWFVYSS